MKMMRNTLSMMFEEEFKANISSKVLHDVDCWWIR
jgi:hypothetical protein